MRTLITGADGFIGTVLAEALRDAGHTVFGLSLQRGDQPCSSTVLPADVTDRDRVERIVEDVRPEAVFHLAAQSHIPRSFSDPEETLKVNVLGSLSLLEAVRLRAPAATVVSVGSSAEYGEGEEERGHIPEDAPVLPSSPYGVSKASQGLLALFYARAYGLRLMHVRPFAVIGPGKVGDVVSDFCRAVVRIEEGGTPTLPVGNLDVVRDFMDVRDCVQALPLIAERGVAGETYNVCNGVGVSLQQILLELQQLASTPFAVVTDPARRRPIDDRQLVGNNAKLRALGYQRRYDLPATVRVTLEYWRVRERQRQAVGA